MTTLPVMTSPLVEVSELAAHPEWLVIDCRHDLANPDAGACAFVEGHIPGAQFLHLDKDLSGEKTGRTGRHPLPEAKRVAEKLGSLGVDGRSRIVFYDADAGMYAARAWWTTRWLGLNTAAVLNGGFAAWKSAGQPVSTELAQTGSKHLAAVVRPAMVADATEVMTKVVRSSLAMLIDARAADRFAGQNETLDPVAGHIPGAVNRFFRHNLGSDGRFKPAATLRAEFAQLLGERAPDSVIHQCGSGVTACHNLLAMEVAGLTGSRLYPGSWSEWCADPERPIAS